MKFYKSLVAPVFLCSLCFLAGDVLAQQQGTACKFADDIIPISALTAVNELPETVLVEGVITQTSTNTGEFGGVFLQALDKHRDALDKTSEAIFVVTSKRSLTKGMHVRITGQPSYQSMGVHLKAANVAAICGHEALNLVSPTMVKLPVNKQFNWQQLSNMWVVLPQSLVISQSYQFGQYGHLGLSSERLVIPTELFAANHPMAEQLADKNKRNLLLMDDGLQVENPSSYRPFNKFSASERLPTGTKIAGVDGILTYLDERPVLQPNLPIKWQHRASKVADIAGKQQASDVRVATFNVLNYFTSLGQRGASNQAEFERQTAKIVAAIEQSESDIIGLVEIENNGFADDSAIATLVSRLNINAQHPWRYITPKEPVLGSASISVGIIYREAIVRPIGAAIAIEAPPFDAETRRHRVPLLQVFETSKGQQFSVVVNHFKSKGSACGVPSDDRLQGNCNGDRVAAATSLSQILRQLVDAKTIDERVIITGDLNAYSMEQPLHVFYRAGYTNIVNQQHVGVNYSYVFAHQSGSLDHILVSPSLTEFAVQSGRWHINADESRGLDYNLEYKSEEQQSRWFSPDPYRSSDHDPVWLDLRF